jgi:hypothetical protein
VLAGAQAGAHDRPAVDAEPPARLAVIARQARVPREQGGAGGPPEMLG